MRTKREQELIDGFYQFLWGTAVYTLVFLIIAIIGGVIFYLGQCWVRWEWIRYTSEKWYEIRVAYLFALVSSFMLAMIVSSNLED
jgi:flagellar biosynthesis component FlhA